MPVKPSTSSYCTPRGMMASVQILMASNACPAREASCVNSRTKRGPHSLASTNSAAVLPTHRPTIYFCAYKTRLERLAP